MPHADEHEDEVIDETDDSWSLSGVGKRGVASDAGGAYSYE